MPFSLRDKLGQKLDELLGLDVIEKAEGLTPWVSPVVVVPKPNGDIHLCVDMRQANSAIVREQNPIRSFLSLVNFCARFIPDLATVSEPLRKLTRKDVHFSWGKEQEVALNELKKRLANTQTLGYFHITAETGVITDASPVGLGAVLVQVQNGEE